MPGDNTPIVIDHEMIARLGQRLDTAATGGDRVMYGATFDPDGAELPSAERISYIDPVVRPKHPLPALDRVRITVGGAEFAAGTDAAASVAAVAPVTFSRMMKLRDRLDQYGLDLDVFLAENDSLEDLNQVTASDFQQHVTFYEVIDEGAGA